MKICMLTTSEITHDTRILNEAKTLSSEHEVVVLSKKYPSQRLPKNLGFKIKLISYRLFKKNRWNIFSAFASLTKQAIKEKADVYHAHDLDGLLCAFAPALLKRKILIYDSHELWADTYKFANLRGIQWLFKPLEKILMLKVKNGITVNDSIGKYLKKSYHKDFLPLYNFPLVHAGKKGLALRKMFPQKRIILHLGSADEGRGLEEMVEASRYFPPNYRLVFIGGGKTEGLIKKKVSGCGLEEKIVFLPAVSPEEIIGTIKQADVSLALTQKASLSYYYSLPNKLFQYAAAGVPILGSNFPEFRSIIVRNGIGDTVDPSKPRLIAEKIKEILKKETIYLKNYNKLPKDKFTWKNSEKNLLEFYKKISLENKALSKRFKLDIFWNALSLGFLGIAGIILNIIVARSYGPKGLGIFNEVFAIYMLASQFAVGSIHLSVQKYIPSFQKNDFELKKIIFSGVLLTLLYSIAVSLIIYFSRSVWGIIYKNEEVSMGVAWIAFGLVGFALNKTFLAVLNGLEKMRHYAFFSALRYFFIVAIVLFGAFQKYPISRLAVAFTGSEIILLILLLIFLRRFLRPLRYSYLKDWLHKHFVFGYHAMLGNVLLDINTRIDILILGLFRTASQVGIYSFAAVLVEGFAQFLGGTLKFNINPKLAILYDKKDRKDLQQFIARGVKLTYSGFALVTIASILLYPLILHFFVGSGGFSQSWLIFAILMTGLAIGSGYMPFQMLLAQTGFPGVYSWLITLVFLFNLIGNIILVPFLGITGSAIATGLSFIFLAVLSKILTWKTIKIKI